MLFSSESPNASTLPGPTILQTLKLRVSAWLMSPCSIGTGAYLILCLLFQTLDSPLSPQGWSWNLAGGLSFGFAIAFGLAYLPVVFLAYVILPLMDGSLAASAWPVVISALCKTAVFGLSCYAVRRLTTTADVDVEDRRTLLVVMVLIPFAALLAGLVPTLNGWFANGLDPNSLLERLLLQTFANAMGLLLGGGFVLLNGIPLLKGVEEQSSPLGAMEIPDQVQGAVFLHLAAGALIVIRIVSVDRFEAYLLLVAPLIAMALVFGLRGVATAFFVVGSTATVMGALGYGVLNGLAMETAILAAVLTSLIVAAVATERAHALHAAQKQAALIMDAIDKGKDLKEALKNLMKDAEVKHLYALPNQDRDVQVEHERLLVRLEELGSANGSEYSRDRGGVLDEKTTHVRTAESEQPTGTRLAD